jgi:hypothetical protein
MNEVDCTRYCLGCPSFNSHSFVRYLLRSVFHLDFFLGALLSLPRFAFWTSQPWRTPSVSWADLAVPRYDALPPSLPPRGLSREAAAQYVGVSPVKFDAMVEDGRMPKAKRIDGRKVWDRRALDRAFDALDEQQSPHERSAGTGWDDYLNGAD